MNLGHLLSAILLLTSCMNDSTEDAQKLPLDSPPSFALVIHGGAGSMSPEGLSKEKEEAYTNALNKALDVGKEILSNGGSSLDAVEQVIRLMEDDSLFNAGKGAVFTHNETNELDASIMDGHTMEAGAVAGVTRVRHPISGARKVMEASPHVLLTGSGAERFLEDQKLEMVAPDFFKTSKNLNRVREIKMKEMGDSHLSIPQDYKFGTVGAVALDKHGHIAAGTSTGGMTNKRWNRIGDSPVIGAGTYANDKIGGVSCTGHGEYFIRYAVAYDLIAKMKYAGLPLSTASRNIIHNELAEIGASGGLIALDKQGNIAMEFNTNGMFRGYVTPDQRYVAMFKSE